MAPRQGQCPKRSIRKSPTVSTFSSRKKRAFPTRTRFTNLWTRTRVNEKGFLALLSLMRWLVKGPWKAHMEDVDGGCARGSEPKTSINSLSVFTKVISKRTQGMQ